ncbi:sugar kinase [Brevibacillus sp. B_LB10_24]|uniref:sugar kinase n=1 Tax=Brevibacillus sp. B_LB10_24 TaxID=3380645 RepID=UPI0038BDAF18
MDVVTFGESMVLFNPLSVGPLRYAQLFDKTVGGAESNVAIALVRLGHQAGWISRLGSDEFGLYVRNFIRGEGVDTSRVIFDDQYPTAVFFKERQVQKESNIYYYRKLSAASRMMPEDLDESYIRQAKILHVTGITPALSDSCEQTLQRGIEIARSHGLQITFDPNIRLKLWKAETARAKLLPIAKQADVVMPGFDEAKLLTGESTPEKMAAFFLELGAKTVVVKLGEKGAYFATDAESGYVPGYPVEQVVDPIGAGDGFAAGMISGMIRGWNTQASVELANRVASYALTVVGDVEGFPFWPQVAPDGQRNIIHR